MSSIAQLSKQRDQIKADAASRNAARISEIGDQLATLRKQLAKTPSDSPEAQQLEETIEALRSERTTLVRPPELGGVMSALNQARRDALASARAELAQRFESLSDADLEKKLLDLDDSRRVVLENMKAASAVLDRRRAKAEVAKLVDSLSPSQKAELLEQLSSDDAEIVEAEVEEG